MIAKKCLFRDPMDNITRGVWTFLAWKPLSLVRLSKRIRWLCTRCRMGQWKGWVGLGANLAAMSFLLNNAKQTGWIRHVCYKISNFSHWKVDFRFRDIESSLRGSRLMSYFSIADMGSSIKVRPLVNLYSQSLQTNVTLPEIFLLTWNLCALQRGQGVCRTVADRLVGHLLRLHRPHLLHLPTRHFQVCCIRSPLRCLHGDIKTFFYDNLYFLLEPLLSTGNRKGTKCRRPWLVVVNYLFGKQLTKSMDGTRRKKPKTV